MHRPARCLLLIAACLGMVDSFAAARLALVIGNGDYQALKTLKNPIRDAQAVAEQLEVLGFELSGGKVFENLDEAQFLEVVKVFKRQAEGREVALMFYSGHGVQLASSPYLLPVDVPNNIDLTARRGINLNDLLKDLDGKAELTVTIFDACREIPELVEEAKKGGFADTVRALGRIENVGRNQIIAYASAANQFALDGDGTHSPYVSTLLKYLPQPGWEIGDLFRQVAFELGQHATQQPEVLVQGVPPRTYYFIGKNDVQADAPPPAPAVVRAEPSKPLAQASIDRYGIKLLPVTGGCFEMGSPSNEAGRDNDERQHEVCVDSFKLGETEVTQGQWRAVMGSNPSNFKNCGDDCPVESVSWQDVQTFITKLNSQTGQHYRLPSEAEWEYAARAGTTTPFSFGGNITPEQANYDGNYPYKDSKKGLYRQTPVPVKSLPANPWGLYEMHGNVWEWTGSLYQDNYDDQHEKESINHASDNARLAVRGGSWNFDARSVRSANRLRYSATGRDIYLGFRLAQD